MNKLLLLCILFIIITPGFAQQKTDQGLWHLTVVDNFGNNGLARVTVAINKTHFYSTNVSGVVDINKSLLVPDCRIRISCIGYQSIMLNGPFPDTIRLARSVTLLHEVKISPNKSPLVTWGHFKTQYDSPMNSTANNEFAEYFPNDAKLTGTIASVEFELNDRQHSIEKPFNVEILSRSDDSIFPDTALVTDSIIVYNPGKKHHVRVDLSKYHIPVQANGFFVIFQTLSASYYDKEAVGEFDQRHENTPAINIFLKRKDDYAGECCDPVPPKLTGPYCMLSASRKGNLEFVKTDQWIVYEQGINFAVSVTIAPD